MSKFTKALEKVQERREQNAAELKKDTPALKVPSLEEKLPNERPSLERGIATVKNTTPDDRIVLLRFPDSMASEQYRMLRTSLKTDLARVGAKVILVSSSIHSEGKTVTATNLAVSLAEDGNTRVVLVDADLRRGKVAQYLGFHDRKTGLSNLLADDLVVKQVMVRNSVPNLFVVPRGPVAKKPSELINSEKIQRVVAELKEHFDYVIIDSPPIMSVADAAMLSRLADGILLVIQAGRTPKPVIAHSIQLFKQAGARLLGYVLTNVEYQSADYRYYSYYSYYGEGEIKDGFKERSKYELKKAGWNLRNLEEQFNQWWEQRMLKKKIKDKGRIPEKALR